MYKLLKIIFVILLFVTIVEAGYYVYVLFIQSQKETSIKSDTTEFSLIISPTSFSPVANSENRIGNDKSNEINIGDNTLNTYGSLMKSFLNKYDQETGLTVVLDVEFDGIVDTIQRESNGVTTAFSVVDEEKKQIIKYGVDDSMKFWQSGTGNSNKPISVDVKDLETGQRIHIKDRIDLLKGSLFTGVFIL